MVIGSVGTGKTALLVRLTQLLAERHLVPIAVRLRDAQEGLDFGELARKRFVADADRALRSDSEGERVWRQLVKDDRIVVLADGGIAPGDCRVEWADGGMERNTAATLVDIEKVVAPADTARV